MSAAPGPTVGRMFRTLKTGQLVFDIAAPSTLFLLLFGVYLQFGVVPVIVLFGMCAALVFWRLQPGIALGVAWVTAIVQMLGGHDPDAPNMAIFIVLFATSAYGSRFVKWAGFASAFVGAAAIAVYIVVIPMAFGPQAVLQSSTGGASFDAVVTLASYSAPEIIWRTSIAFFGFGTLFLLSWTLGLLSKTWRTARESRRAQMLAVTQQIAAEQDVIVEQERNRIARDMHDVVAHSLAVVIAQADGARYARATDPAAADEALTTISSTAREALGDVRLLLGQLRHSQGDGPQPVLADLGKLIDQMRASGLSLEFREEGEPFALGTGQQLAIYRIVQEALTNALRHGNTAVPVSLWFRWDCDALDLEVTNTLGFQPQLGDGRPGHGLAGMRERAVLMGGTFSTAVREQQFTVTAHIPATSARSETRA